MSVGKLIFRSLQFYWRSHLGVLLGTILTCAILTGALVVGDSVRFSLKQMALARLGQTTLALTSGDRFFRADLAQELASQLHAPIAPLLMLRGAVTTPDGTHRANEVQVLGVDERFWNLSPSAVAWNGTNNSFASDEIAVSESLATRLQLKIGDSVVVRLEQPAFVTRDLPLAGQADASVAVRLRVRNIVGDEQFGRFSLQGNQVPALSVFLSLNALQQQIQRAGRVNALLVGQQQKSGMRCDAATANAALANVWTLSDADLELRELPEKNEFELRTKRVFLTPVVADAAFAVASNAVGVLTYFVNEIRFGDHATPYSFIAATSPSQVGVPLRDDEIAINSWLAEDLGAKPGSEVTLRYFVIGERRELLEQKATFRVCEIIPLKADASWMPDFPGLADTDNCREWKPGIPINLDRIRPKDETYWKEYRGTPKAFVTLAAGQRLWANRFGNLTAIRFVSGRETLNAATSELERALLKQIGPAALGFTFTDVRGRALQASEKSQDFGQIFIGFSFFLIVAALLLTALLFVFNLEQRNAEVGLLRALGFSDRKVRWIFLLEGACVAGLGTLLGLLAGVAFTKLTLHGLATIWRGAVGTSNFIYHEETTSLITGAGMSLLAAIGAMALAQRGQTRRSLAGLLASGAEVEMGGAPASGFHRHLGLGIGVTGLLGAVALVATSSHGQGPELAEVFFCSGLLVL
jgi:putative ABC transport system permease protein